MDQPLRARADDPAGGSLSQAGFERLRNWLYDHAGIRLEVTKTAMVTARLMRRVRQLGLSDHEGYLHAVLDGSMPDEVQALVDLMTTNETYFFREPAHFEQLRQRAAGAPQRPFRFWSAACSTGCEGYSAAMVLAASLGSRQWEVVGTDLSREAVVEASRGLYRAERLDLIPPDCLRDYCLRGKGEMAGMMLIDRRLRERCRFRQANLLAANDDLGMFDVIFLRNVLIYFDREAKARVIERLVEHMEPETELFLGHADSIPPLPHLVRQVRPTVYRRA